MQYRGSTHAMASQEPRAVQTPVLQGFSNLPQKRRLVQTLPVPGGALTMFLSHEGQVVPCCRETQKNSKKRKVSFFC